MESWTYFSQTQTILSRGFISMLKYGSDMPKILFTWMIAIAQTLTCSLTCSGLPRNVQGGLSSLLNRIRSAHRLSVITGILGSVLIRANGNERMEYVVNAEENIKLKTLRNAKLASKLDRERELLLMQERALEAAEGLKSLGSNVSHKRKRPDDIAVPRYRCGYAWSVSSSNTSPSALYSECAPPLPTIPQHLIDNLVIQATLIEAQAHIKVETPFNVDRIQNMLSDHPNQPFIHSVMRGLREGFWPLDEGDWNLELEDKIENYPCNDIDMDSIHAFHDREVEAGL
jgi:hypothetical protein